MPSKSSNRAHHQLGNDGALPRVLPSLGDQREGIRAAPPLAMQFVRDARLHEAAISFDLAELLSHQSRGVQAHASLSTRSLHLVVSNTAL
jgi:hypothetical protein